MTAAEMAEMLLVQRGVAVLAVILEMAALVPLALVVVALGLEVLDRAVDGEAPATTVVAVAVA
jgi:hypothetical protein